MKKILILIFLLISFIGFSQEESVTQETEEQESEKKDKKWLFKYTGKKDLRKLISKYAQENEILILEIKQHTDTLEDLFKKLTK